MFLSNINTEADDSIMDVPNDGFNLGGVEQTIAKLDE